VACRRLGDSVATVAVSAAMATGWQATAAISAMSQRRATASLLA